MIGGAGTVYGPLIGAVLLAGLSEYTRTVTSVQGLSLVLYGTLLVIIIAFLPNGLIDLFKRRKKMPAPAQPVLTKSTTQES
jgi:branched-chain amino acid transport system permease protein